MTLEVVEKWVERAYCPACEQYLWSNPGSPNIMCRCGHSGIINHQRTGGAIIVLNEVGFRYYGARELGYRSYQVMFRKAEEDEPPPPEEEPPPKEADPNGTSL